MKITVILPLILIFNSCEDNTPFNISKSEQNKTISSSQLNKIEQLDLDELEITLGNITNSSDYNFKFSTKSSKTRATINNKKVYSMKSAIEFRYNGDSEVTDTLGSGSIRKQIGLKLMSKNTCNLLYVMWRFGVNEKIVVQMKSNPNAEDHSDCGNSGYSTIFPDSEQNPFPHVGSGMDQNIHSLYTELEPLNTNDGSIGNDYKLTVFVDGYEVWTKDIFNLPANIAGISGFRTDNGNFDFNFYSDASKEANSWFVSFSGINNWSQLQITDQELNKVEFGNFNDDNQADAFRTYNGNWEVSLSGKENWIYKNRSSNNINDLRFGDFNGDGKTDVLKISNGAIYISISGESSWQYWNISNNTIDELRFGDFNGDGETDIFRTENGSWQVSLSGTSNWLHWKTSNNTISSLYFGDFNGDGITDVIKANGSKWHVSLAATSNWFEWKISTDRFEMVKFGDFNGDAKTDIIKSENGYWKVSFGAKSDWENLNASSHTLEHMKIVDINGDGISDILRSTRN
jgi:hypothetical protein